MSKYKYQKFDVDSQQNYAHSQRLFCASSFSIDICVNLIISVAKKSFKNSQQILCQYL